MNPTLKTILLYSAKNAVNALLTNATLAGMMPGVINLHSPAGLWNIGKVALGTIITREAMFWGPKLLKWANSIPPDAT